MKSADPMADTFLEEARERLTELEATLLSLESDPTNSELVAQAFRALHTIKGSGSMFGFDEVAQFTHKVETVFDEIRSGRLDVSAPLIDLALASKDIIRRLLAGEEEQTRAERHRIIQSWQALLPTATTGAAETPNATKEALPIQDAPKRPEKTYRVGFAPLPDLFRNGTNPIGIFRELATMGRMHIVAHTRRIPGLKEMAPETCYVAWDVILSTAEEENTIRDAFLFVEGLAEIRIDLLDDGISAHDENYRRLGEILVDRGDIDAIELQSILRSQRRVGELLVEKGIAPSEVIEAAILEQKVVREARARRAAQPDQTEAGSSIRVAADKLDLLVDLVGELVIAQARLGQIAETLENGELTTLAESMDRLSTELRNSTLKIRMVPIGTTFGKFKRLVRDLSAELGKGIDLQTEGAETELDKTVIERLSDPLIHLIRNSCDHGMETPEVRRAAGKPERGSVTLRAYHTGPHVFVEIQDDGAGLDLVAIRQRAIEKNLILADSTISESELTKLIFMPGFSTAANVSNLSGRGVGMDVVKRAIDALRGTIEVETKRGVGTTIRLRLPLTLAIIEGLLVQVAEVRYVLPMSLVEECIELTQEDVEQSRGNHVAAVRGELVPYLRLRDWFAVDGERPSIEQVVITAVDGQRFGFAVDGVVGQHQTVIKSLGRMYQAVDGLSGATILGDGTVALIVDVPALLHTTAAASDALN